MSNSTSHAPSRDLGPAVQFPPPILFVGGFGLAALLQRVWPIAAPWGDNTLASRAGLALLVIGFVLVLTGMVTFRRARVAVYPNRPARSLVTHGVYLYTRNPMYAGLTSAHVGGALATGLVWSLLVLPVVMVLLRVFVIRREEQHLRERFPVEYAEYCSRVRRWI